jgi:hypothetical protein
MRGKRLLLLAAVGLVSLALAAVLALLLRPSPSPYPDARIHPGMPLAGVEAVFGKPADLEAPATSKRCRTLVWLDPSGPIPVEFGEDDRVMVWGVRRPMPPPTGILDKIRREFGR